MIKSTPILQLSPPSRQLISAPNVGASAEAVRQKVPPEAHAATQVLKDIDAVMVGSRDAAAAVPQSLSGLHLGGELSVKPDSSQGDQALPAVASQSEMAPLDSKTANTALNQSTPATAELSTYDHRGQLKVKSVQTQDDVAKLEDPTPTKNEQLLGKSFRQSADLQAADLRRKATALQMQSQGIEDIQNKVEDLQTVVDHAVSRDLNAQQREGLNKAAQSLVEEISDIVETSQFNGNPLLPKQHAVSQKQGPEDKFKMVGPEEVQSSSEVDVQQDPLFHSSNIDPDMQLATDHNTEEAIKAEVRPAPDSGPDSGPEATPTPKSEFGLELEVGKTNKPESNLNVRSKPNHADDPAVEPELAVHPEFETFEDTETRGLLSDNSAVQPSAAGIQADSAVQRSPVLTDLAQRNDMTPKDVGPKDTNISQAAKIETFADVETSSHANKTAPGILPSPIAENEVGIETDQQIGRAVEKNTQPVLDEDGEQIPNLHHKLEGLSEVSNTTSRETPKFGHPNKTSMNEPLQDISQPVRLQAGGAQPFSESDHEPLNASPKSNLQQGVPLDTHVKDLPSMQTQADQAHSVESELLSKLPAARASFDQISPSDQIDTVTKHVSNTSSSEVASLRNLEQAAKQPLGELMRSNLKAPHSSDHSAVEPNPLSSVDLSVKGGPKQSLVSRPTSLSNDMSLDIESLDIESLGLAKLNLETPESAQEAQERVVAALSHVKRALTTANSNLSQIEVAGKHFILQVDQTALKASPFKGGENPLEQLRAQKDMVPVEQIDAQYGGEHGVGALALNAFKSAVQISPSLAALAVGK